MRSAAPRRSPTSSADLPSVGVGGFLGAVELQLVRIRAERPVRRARVETPVKVPYVPPSLANRKPAVARRPDRSWPTTNAADSISELGRGHPQSDRVCNVEIASG